MSWNFCAISGEPLHEPVVSNKSGYVFEKRIIEKHIKSTGQCPLSGQALSFDDLIPIKLDIQTKPRGVAQNSVPGIIKTFNNEWDALMLETYSLRQQLETVRQELSHALYQHDAACRVIARLIRERDEARKEVSVLIDRIKDGKMELEEDNQNGGAQAEEQLTLPQDIIDSINETILNLNQLRKDRKKDTEYHALFAQIEAICGYTVKESLSLHNSAQPGIASLDVSNYLVVSGGKDGRVVAYDIKQKLTVAQIDIGKEVLQVSLISAEKVVVLTSNSIEIVSLNEESKTFTKLTSFTSNQPLSSLAIHPNGSLFAVASKNGIITYYDLNQALPVLVVKELVGKVEILSLAIHPDGNLLSVGCSDGSTKLWNIASNQLLTSLEDGGIQAINLLSFSENGYILALGSTQSAQVNIFDLRKAKCVKTIESIHVTALQFDKSGNSLIVGEDSGSVKIHETKKWNNVGSFLLHKEAVTSIKASPLFNNRFGEYSKEIVTGSADNQLIVSQ